MRSEDIRRALHDDPIVKLLNRSRAGQDNVPVTSLPLGCSALQALCGGEPDPVLERINQTAPWWVRVAGFFRLGAS